MSSDNKSRLGNSAAALSTKVSTHNGNGRAGACTCVSVLINWRCAPQVTPPRRCPTTTNTGPACARLLDCPPSLGAGCHRAVITSAVCVGGWHHQRVQYDGPRDRSLYCVLGAGLGWSIGRACSPSTSTFNSSPSLLCLRCFLLCRRFCPLLRRRAAMRRCPLQ